MKTFAVLIGLSFYLVGGACFAGEPFIYENYSPIASIANESGDSRVVFEDRISSEYGDGHDFGYVSSCDEKKRGSDCIVVGSFAISKPAKVLVGEKYVVGKYEFTITKKVTLNALGVSIPAVRVDVRVSQALRNSFYYSPQNGVVSIIFPCHECGGISEQFYILQGRFGPYVAEKASANN